MVTGYLSSSAVLRYRACYTQHIYAKSFDNQGENDGATVMFPYAWGVFCRMVFIVCQVLGKGIFTACGSPYMLLVSLE